MGKYKEEDEEVILTLQGLAEHLTSAEVPVSPPTPKIPEKPLKIKEKRNPSATEFIENSSSGAVEGFAPEPVSNEPFSDDAYLTDDYQGQLAVDVYQTDDEIVIVSTIAGVKVEDVEVHVNNDMVTIKGMRRYSSEVDEDQYYYQECYWGGFSRSIILPEDVDADGASAALEHGILTVRLPKTHKSRVKRLEIQEND